MPYIMIFEHEVDDYDGCQTSMETDWDTFETYSSLIEAAGIVYSYNPKFKVIHIFNTDRCIADICQADVEKERDRILVEREVAKQRKIAEAAEDQRIRDHAHNVLEYQYYLKLKEKFENGENNC